MPDFITAGAIRSGLTLPDDALTHTTIAHRVLSQVRRLPAGSVLALQGSWGRGKTDVLARMAQQAEGDDTLAWLWINPWQYGDANLLTPLVLELLAMIPEQTRINTKALQKAARTVLLAGISFGLKASKHLVPGVGAVLADGAGAAGGLLKGLFEARDIEGQDTRPDPDPIAAMSVQFSALVDAVLEATGARQLVICVDDLDRCLPDRQVALLQALRFLLSSDAEVRFAIAIDPTLARQALRVHYNEQHFDPDLYLDKMFDLRINLPAINDADVGALIRSHLRRAVPEGVMSEVLAAKMAARWLDPLADQAAAALCVPDLRNPRLVRRVIDRLYLLMTTEGTASLTLGAATDTRWMLIWLAIAERWPELRAALQSDRIGFQKNLVLLHQHMIGGAVRFDTAALSMLPAPSLAQRQVFAAMGRERLDSSVPAFMLRFDTALVRAGL